MTDRNRAVIRPQGDGDRASSPEPGSVLRAFTWLMLVVSAVGNTVSSFAGVSTAAHLGFGVVSAICAFALIVQYVRRQR
jgi:hypothetical protein